MTCQKGTVAGILLPKHCDSEAEAEPKRNIICVAENDFSSKILQVGYLIDAPWILTAMPVPDDTKSSGFVSSFDVFIEPTRGFSNWRNEMGLALPDADHRDDQENSSG